MKHFHVKTVQTTVEGEYFSVFPEDLALDKNGGVYINGDAPALPTDQEAVEMVNLGGDYALAQDFDPEWVPRMARSQSWLEAAMWPVYLEDEEGDEFDDDDDIAADHRMLPLEIDND